MNQLDNVPEWRVLALGLAIAALHSGSASPATASFSDRGERTLPSHAPKAHLPFCDWLSDQA
jgi:hypothetical protein